MAEIDLAQLSWRLRGWRPWTWKLFTSMETGRRLRNDIGPVPARVPGTVQQALLDAGFLEDWHVGMNSLKCEWVEHRHWEISTRVDGQRLSGARRIQLAADGLDYSGWILVDGKEVASFTGVARPKRVDLTQHLGDGADHQLGIVFDTPPREQGQIGFTSRSRHFKPRYSYGWDWCPRFVPIGVWGPIALLTDLHAELELLTVSTALGDDLHSGELAVRFRYAPAGPAQPLTLRIRLQEGDTTIVSRDVPLAPGDQQADLTDFQIQPWWPNGEGPSVTYRVVVQVLGPDARTCWAQQREVGFKRIRWLPCEGAPADALPWICEINGRPIFLQGVNWSPIRLNHADLTEQDYRTRIDLYRDLGCNLFRIWGGAYLETKPFYELCDRAGILVWQEFPLSSSGIDNWPPEEPEAIAELTRIARSYIRRRAHHVSLLMWCGGNELLGGADGSRFGMDRPVSPEHPCLAALRDVVLQEDPDRRFQHTSPSGPRAGGNAKEYGAGVHHEVHGPWGFDGDMEAFRKYWRGDDALFRAEVGVPGACDVKLIKRYCPDGAWWPPGNPTWAHSCLWWTAWDRFVHLTEMDPQAGLEAYVKETQHEQREALALAANACKRRFPRCGGFLVWHGHDCFPCPINNSVIDFEGQPKAGYFGLKQVFTRPAGR